MYLITSKYYFFLDMNMTLLLAKRSQYGGCVILYTSLSLLIFFFFYITLSDWISCRQVLNLMVIFGFMLNYALRVNLTIAIVAMVPTVHHDTNTTTNITEIVTTTAVS